MAKLRIWCCFHCQGIAWTITFRVPHLDISGGDFHSFFEASFESLQKKCLRNQKDTVQQTAWCPNLYCLYPLRYPFSHWAFFVLRRRSACEGATRIQIQQDLKVQTHRNKRHWRVWNRLRLWGCGLWSWACQNHRNSSNKAHKQETKPQNPHHVTVWFWKQEARRPRRIGPPVQSLSRIRTDGEVDHMCYCMRVDR